MGRGVPVMCDIYIIVVIITIILNERQFDY